MILRLALAASVLALAACQPAAPPADPVPLAQVPATDAPVAPASASGPCAASVKVAWPSNLSADASVSGPACDKAAVLLVVRDKAQQPLLVWSAPTIHVFGLYDKTDATGMQAGLTEWLDQRTTEAELSTTLPEWKTGAEGPGETTAEFPFHAEEWMDRDTYESIRKAGLPTFSFPQGKESAAVYVLRDGALEPVGVQQFPG